MSSKNLHEYVQRLLLKSSAMLSLSLVMLGFILVGCNRQKHTDQHGDAHSHGHHDEHKEEYEKGPHRGRLLAKDDFQLEVTIFEAGVPPEFRVYVYESEKSIAPHEVMLSVDLKRLGGRTDTFSFTAEKDCLKGSGTVDEPHSFDVSVKANYKGKEYLWDYASYEGRTELSEEAQKSANITVERAGEATIRTRLLLHGKISPSEHRIAHIIPRFPGVVKEGRKHIGDPVDKGEVLAIIESNQSLQPYQVKSQIAGTIISGHLILGEFVPENQWVFIVADLSEVWTDFRIHSRDFSKIKLGQKVLIKTATSAVPIESSISYVTPFADEKTQTKLVRTVVQNKDGRLYPGMFASGEVFIEERRVPVAVKASALQTFRDWSVVFLKVGNTFEVRPIEVGQNDGEWVEVVSGLEAGQSYVSENSFIIKADILKSGASHDH